MATKAQLPDWLDEPQDGVFHVDIDKLYPQLLGELGVEKPNKYWLEVVYQCAKLEVRRVLLTQGEKPWPPNLKQIHMKAADKERWALRNYSGSQEDVDQATKGGEAREHYKELRGFLPQ